MQSRTSTHVGGNELSEQVDEVYCSLYITTLSTRLVPSIPSIPSKPNTNVKKTELFSENSNNLAAAWVCSGELPQYRHTNLREQFRWHATL